MRFILALAFAALLIGTSAFAGSLDLGFNDDSFQVGYEHPLRDDPYGSTFANARYLYNGDEDTELLSAGVDFLGKPGNYSGLNLGAGAKLYLGETDPDIDFVNLGIGLRGAYLIPQLQGVGLAGALYYAPEVFSGRDSEGLWEGQLRLTYTVIPKVQLYLGYQNIQLDVEGPRGDRTIDEGLRLGFIGTF